MMIEADETRYRTMRSRLESLPKAKAIHARVGVHAYDNLGALLRQHKVELRDTILISIDVDGDDAVCWQAAGLQADLVVIEYNQRCPLI